jgi:hypothetical protein
MAGIKGIKHSLAIRKWLNFSIKENDWRKEKIGEADVIFGGVFNLGIIISLRGDVWPKLKNTPRLGFVWRLCAGRYLDCFTVCETSAITWPSGL